MAAQLPTCSPGIPVHQQMYPVAHSSGGQYTTQLVPPVRSNDSLVCSSDMFKDINLTIQPSSDNITSNTISNHEKVLGHEAHRQFSIEKRSNIIENCILSKFSSCSEVNKLNNNIIHDQHIFDEYVRICGEDGHFRSWSDNSLPTTSASSFHDDQHASIPHRCTSNILVYEENQAQTDIPSREFSDCRLESSWKRNHLNPISSSHGNSNFINVDHSLISSNKNELKGCRNAHIRLNNIDNKTSEDLNSSETIATKGQFDFQALSAGQFSSVLPYAPPPPNYHHPLNEQLLCHEPQISTMESCLQVSEEGLIASANGIKKTAIKKENKQIQATALQTLNRPQSTQILHINSPQASTVITPSLSQSSILNVSTSQGSSVHTVNALQTSSANNAVITTQNSLTHGENISENTTAHIFNSIPMSSSQNVGTSQVSPLSTDNVTRISSIQVIAPQISLNHPIKNSSDRDSIPQDNLKHTCTSNINTTALSMPLPISKTLHTSSQCVNLSINSIAPPISPTTNATPTSSQLKIVMAIEPSEPAVQVHHHVASSDQKFQKDNISGGQEHMRKNTFNRSINTHVASEMESCCLLCGIAVEASSHCLIDTLMTVPSKISISEKLSQIVGFPIPRDFLPSLHICPKCFHLINEVDVLEHRLNICRREILYPLEHILERNGIHVSPYKRYQRQQCLVPFQAHEMQFPHYQQPSSNACLHAPFQNEGYQIANHCYAPQNQVHMIPDSLPGQNCEINVEHHSGTQLPVHGPHQENNFQLQGHYHNSHHAQLHYPLHQDLSNHQLSVQHINTSQNSHHKESQIQNITGDCKQQQRINYNCGSNIHQTSLSMQNSLPIFINNSQQLHQNQLPRNVSDKSFQGTLPSCQVQLPLLHIINNKKTLPKDNCQQPKLPNSLQNLSQENLDINDKRLSKNILMPQSLADQPSIQVNQKATSLLDIETVVTLESTDENKIILQQGGSLVNENHCQAKNDLLNRNVNGTNCNNQDTYFSSNQNHDSLISRPMSMLLSTYIQPDSREFNAELIVLNQLHLEKEKSNLPQKNEIIVTGKDCIPDLDKSPIVSEHNWNNNTESNNKNNKIVSNNHELSLDPLNGSDLNPTDCDIDIEKCDVNADPTKESVSLSSTTNENIKVEACLSNELNLIKSRIIDQSHKSRPNCLIPQATDIKTANVEVNPISSLSPAVSAMEMFFSPSSPPPPPEGPPEGLRNVQDATEYHKPTLLGKNIKVKKHAKLQICRQCDQVFSNRQALIRHIERRHKSYNLTYYSCDTCHRKFNSEKTLKHHLQSHKTYPCKFCNKIFLRKVKLKKHVDVHIQKNLTCEVCKKETGSMQALISHLKSHDRTPKSFICAICSKVFTCKRNLDHHSRIHSGEKPFSCVNCNKHFRHRSNMVAHHKICSGTQIFICSRAKCGKVFALKSLFDRHILEHDGNYAHSCSICNKGFAKSSDLLYHIDTHGEISTTISKKCNFCVTKGCNAKNDSSGARKNTFCPICGKVVSRKDSLQDHLAFHEGKRNYKCEQCSASFIYRSNLFFHVKTVHWLKRPYTCDSCHKTFTNSGSHKLHLRTHTGERPFECDSCGKTFTSRGNYNRHLKCHVFHDHGSVESCSDGAIV